MKIKKIFAVTMSIVLLMSVVGCTKNQASSIPKSTIPMKTVTQKSKNDYVSFEFELPKTWETFTNNYLCAGGFDKVNLKEDVETEEETLPYTLTIENYHYSQGTWMELPEEAKQAYKDLFAGNSEPYKKYLNLYVEYIIYKDSYSGAGSPWESPSGILDYFDLFQPTENVSKESASNKKYIKDFKYKRYDGKYGKITEVQYSYDMNRKTHQAINCIREDIPYMTSGVFDSTLDVSSGDIALWVADSLKVTEHFEQKNNNTERKD